MPLNQAEQLERESDKTPVSHAKKLPSNRLWFRYVSGCTCFQDT